MNTEKKFGFATRQIHAGHMENAAGSLCAPIYQTSTFAFSTVQQGGARFAGEEGGYIYTRLGNPTLGAVEEKLASLEGGEAAMAAASGMGAISSALWTSVVAGDEIVADETLYGCTYALLNHGMTKFGVKVTLTDLSDIENLKKNLTDKTRVVYFETPCNPTLKLLDIELIAKTAHAFNPDIRVIVDNTFCTPYLQRPLELGADVVVHSATKYLNGHGDVIAGIVVGKADFISQCRMFGLKDMTGAVLSPFDAFLMARGLKTLDIRMERHCANAQKVAAFFTSHPAVAKVYYPGLDTFPGHEIAAKQMKLPGGMISIELKADRAAVAALEKAEPTEEGAFVLQNKEYLTKKSVWAFGGDGWAYDIGFGGIDHVLAQNRDINMLVMDTEVYSNTGGQSSKATPTAAVAKFAAGGKEVKKKDLGAIAMSYGYIYVAQVAMGYDQAQTLKAIREAESYPGPAIVIAYCPCLEHGIKAGMSCTQEEMKKAVECGYWHLYRYDPRRIAEGKNPFQLDSPAPDSGKMMDYLKGENRYASLQINFPDRAQRLYEKTVQDAKDRYAKYRKMAED